MRKIKKITSKKEGIQSKNKDKSLGTSYTEKRDHLLIL